MREGERESGRGEWKHFRKSTGPHWAAAEAEAEAEAQVNWTGFNSTGFNSIEFNLIQLKPRQAA